MDTDARRKFAVRCIVVSTQSGVASLARAYARDPARRDRLQQEVLDRGVALLRGVQADSEPMSTEFTAVMRAALGTLER